MTDFVDENGLQVIFSAFTCNTPIRKIFVKNDVRIENRSGGIRSRGNVGIGIETTKIWISIRIPIIGIESKFFG